MTFCLPSTCRKNHVNRVRGVKVRLVWAIAKVQYWCAKRRENGRADRGMAHVGVEQTQNELEVRLFSGDERHRGG